MHPHPPKWPDRFLSWYCNPELLEDLQGDLHELFYRTYDAGQQRKARWLFSWLVLRSLRWSVIKRQKQHKNSLYNMTWNNFKIAFRVLWRDKVNTSLNLLGLTIGITCFMLLGTHVRQELSYDHFHSKKDRIYRSWLKEDYGEGKVFFNSETPLRFEDLFETEFPAVETAVQYRTVSNLVGRGENRVNEQMAIISPEFFDVFDFTVAYGNQEQILPDQNSLILSERYAQKYFGNDNPIGRTLGIQLGSEIRDFTITAVFQNMPYESSIKFDMALSNAINKDIYGERTLNAWFNIAPETYVLLREGTSITAVEDKVQDVVMSYLGEQVTRGQYQIGFQPLTDIHLNPDIPQGIAPVSNPQYVLILGAIGLLVLIMACINYTTLSAGQSLKRTLEVGMRKVLGAGRGTLIQQYLSESILLAFAAMLIGTAIALLIIPTFNRLAGTEILFTFEWWHLLAYAVIGLLIGLIAGGYPALIISGFKIINVLKGSGRSVGGNSVRKGLIVVQFSGHRLPHQHHAHHEATIGLPTGKRPGLRLQGSTVCAIVARS